MPIRVSILAILVCARTPAGPNESLRKILVAVNQGVAHPLSVEFRPEALAAEVYR
jgi:hypothetical protein